MRPKQVALSVALVAALSAGDASADIHLVPNPNGPLAGKTIVFSPGHGRMLDGTWWRFQRGVTHDMREDIHTNEIFIGYIQYYLTNAGAHVESVRERSFQTHEVIVDNGGVGYSETGLWNASTSAPAYYGTSGYRYAAVSGLATATAEFRPTLPGAGRYPVYVWYTPGSNRTTDARFTVHHSGGSTTAVVNQQTLGNSWIFLGEFHFPAGTSGRVVLSNQGSNPTKFAIADAVRFGGGIGASGLPRWQESASAFLPHKGFSSSRSDVTIRPAYGVWLAGGDTSRWRSDFLYFALHTNASSGTARGLSTFSYSNGRTPSWGSAGSVTYPTTPSPLQTQSDELRSAVHAEVLSAVRASFDPSWRDRSVHLMNFGELRESRNMPSALIELGFHDNAEDAALLSNARYRAVSARAIYKGIVRYWLGPNTPIIPLPPRDLRVENLGAGSVRVSWAPQSDPLEPSAVATSYRVYVSDNGRGFDDGVSTTATSLVLGGFAAGQRVFVRVAAVNGGGESLATGVGAARVGDGDGALIVDGFDRAFTHTHDNVTGRFTGDYAVDHLDALDRVLPAGVPVDYAVNEAVGGVVSLDDYALVDWLLGRESSLDRTFDASEQSLVEGYLQRGGALLVTGTEIGWDLEARGGGVRFLHEVLGADYLRDDAGTRVARTAVGSPFGSVGIVSLHDGTQGGYDAAFPDVLAPYGSAKTALAWETAGAPGAGTAQSAPYKVVVLGFPLESVLDPAVRDDVAREAIAFLLPNGFGGGSTGGGSTGGASTGGGSTGGGSTGGASTGTTAPAATARGGSSGSGGCSLVPGRSLSQQPALFALLLLALLGRRRVEGRLDEVLGNDEQRSQGRRGQATDGKDP